ncbi:AraC-type DNA-binding protein [Spirosomataceae bacterium TFI 002]|nr:AraC-type DNA-binding protein [Spirosomataceae bacterium TFI 002]
MIYSKKALFQKLPLSPGNSFLIKRYESPFFETPWHFHDEYELVYCEKGFGKKFIGNHFTSYKSGEMYFLGKNLPHWFKADDSFYTKPQVVKPSSIVLQFLENFMGDSFFKSHEMSGVLKVLARSQNGIEITGESKEKIKNIMVKMLHSDPMSRLALLIEIFSILSQSKELSFLSSHHVLGINPSDSDKMNAVLDYSLKNFRSDITIDTISALVNLSPAAFCRYFKSRTQKTYMSFIIDLRLEEASKLLKESEQNILQICYECGFKNLSNFNRAFRRKYGVSPREYRFRV